MDLAGSSASPGSDFHNAEVSAPDNLTVVVVGAAEGGGEVLLRLFAQAPLDSTTTFLVIAALYTDQLPLLADQLRHRTALAVTVVDQWTPLRPNQIYLFSRERRMLLTSGAVGLREIEYQPGRRGAIDLGLRAVADLFGRDAVAIILSGQGSDGALGLARIKELGGITLAQEPDEAAFDGMPRAAIATGFVDYVLPVDQIPAQILAYRGVGQRLRLPADDDDRETDGNALRE
ncbi:MAG: chemotaxis protein CheB, partial [Chloroflexales bacterium]|nr:chemotaxis protein CheB [Chloroflexales bacterium]